MVGDPSSRFSRYTDISLREIFFAFLPNSSPDCMSLVPLGILAMVGFTILHISDRSEYLRMVELRSIIEMVASDIPDLQDENKWKDFFELHKKRCASKSFRSRCVMSPEAASESIQRLLKDARCFPRRVFDGLRMADPNEAKTILHACWRDLIIEDESENGEKFVELPDARVCANNIQFKRVLEINIQFVDAEIYSRFSWGYFQPV